MAQKRKTSWQAQILGLGVFVTAIVFMPTTIVLIFGMIPTIVIAFFDTAKSKTRAITVGCINFAGTMPFILKLWSVGHDVEDAVEIALSPQWIIVMWSAAGMGWLIDWALSGLVGTVMIERGKARIEEIRKQQEQLVERWGREVTGELPLDAYGFPIQNVSAAEDNG